MKRMTWFKVNGSPVLHWNDGGGWVRFYTPNENELYAGTEQYGKMLELKKEGFVLEEVRPSGIVKDAKMVSRQETVSLNQSHDALMEEIHSIVWGDLKRRVAHTNSEMQNPSNQFADLIKVNKFKEGLSSLTREQLIEVASQLFECTVKEKRLMKGLV